MQATVKHILAIKCNYVCVYTVHRLGKTSEGPNELFCLVLAQQPFSNMCFLHQEMEGS